MGRDGGKFSKSQRMQMKALIILLGILLILLLLFGKLVVTLIHMWESRAQKLKPYVPVIQLISNVWIMELEEDGLLVFQDGANVFYSYGTVPLKNLQGQVPSQKPYVPDRSVREQVADVVLTDGLVTGIVPKTGKINGRILGADGEGVEVEGYGKLPLSPSYKGYKLYGKMEMCTVRDILFGYDFTDLCIYNGEICGVLLAREEAMESIRVLIRASDYSANLHSNPILSCNTGYTVRYGSYDDLKSEHHEAGEKLEITRESGYFISDRIWVIPDALTGRVSLENCNRSQGKPSYRGQIELFKAEEGIAVINEVSLEEYLYSVVPSEMPSKYPMEALKAQAVCARTYAYNCMMHAGYPQYGAHADDSTAYQVYNNITEQESTTTAVKETYGQLLHTAEGELASTYYYSTSCGVGSDAGVWKSPTAPATPYLGARAISSTYMSQVIRGSGGGVNEATLGERLRNESAFRDFIMKKNENDFEVNESWYRWSYQVKNLDTGYMLELLKKRYQANPRLVLTLADREYVSVEPGELDQITDLYVESRGSGGVADELIIKTETQQIKVISEYNIRYVLSDGKSKVTRQDGRSVDSPSLLPSAFLILDSEKSGDTVTGYTITGGGYGHGVGLSQNAARHMADSGYSAGEILRFFYKDCSIDNVHE